jgi:hypothetical protein
MTHRPWFKVAINTCLRLVQTRKRPARLWVMYSRFTEDGRLLGYGFGWVVHLRA